MRPAASLFLMLVAPSVLWGMQEAPKALETGSRVIVTQADESKFPEINVYFELRSTDGTAIRDARQAEFRLLEDGTERPILGFDAPVSVEQRATTIVLVVDRSGSMREEGKIAGMRAAVRTFVEGLPAGSRVSVVAFGSEVVTACPFTDDYQRIKDAVDALEPFGATRFYDAVCVAVKQLEKETGRKAILALTDGMDTDSAEADLDTTIQRARRANVPVHTLGLGRERQIAVDSLEQLAEGTRGQAYLAESANELRRIYEEIAERLGAVYHIRYASQRPIQDGTLRPIQLYHAASNTAGEAKVYIPGMVVNSPGWAGLFLAILCSLVALMILSDRMLSPRSAS